MESRQEHDMEESGMARSDLYKAAKMSTKLFKLIREGEEIEPWVLTKITKAAEALANVYQYVNYEKHFRDQESEIMNNPALSESKRTELRNKLFEAKSKVAELKKQAAKEKVEKEDKLKEARADKKVGKVDKSEKKQYFSKSTHGNKTVGARHVAGEGESDQDLKNRVERDVKTKGGTLDSWREVAEGKAKCCCEEKGKTKCPVHGKMDEAKELKGGQKKLDKDHNGKLDKKDFKMLRAGKKDAKLDERDMGKHNNGKTTGFKAVAKKAAKEYGSKEAGERVAGAVKAKMAKAGKLEETVSAEKAKVREAIARAKALSEAKGKKPKWLEKAEVEAEEKEGKKVSKAEEKKVGIVKESAELDAIKAITARVLRG